MPEWVVIYKAIGDFSDLTRKAAEALAEMQAMKKAAEALSQAELQAGPKIVAAREADIKAMKDQSAAMNLLVQNSQLYNRWVNWQGATNEQQYLSNKEREVQYERLLNIQRQRGFYSVYQDYAYRNQELAQRYLWNRAIQQGYATPEQYLNYLTNLRHAMELENAVWRERVQALNAATTAALSNANAASGGHESAMQYLTGTSKLQQGLRNLSQQVANPQVNLQDTQFGIDLAADMQALQQLDAFTANPDVVLTDDQMRGAAFIDMRMMSALSDMVARPKVELDTSGLMTGIDAITAALARMGQLRQLTVSARAITAAREPQMLTGGANTGAGPPVGLNDAGFQASISRDQAELQALDRMDIAPRAQLDDAALMAGIARDKAAIETLAVPVRVTPIPGMTAAPASKIPFGFSSNAANAQYAAEAAAQDKVAASAARAAPAEAALGDAERKSGLDAVAAAAGQGALAGETDKAAASASLLGKQFTLFGGAFGSTAFFGTIAAWHAGLDLIIEALAILIPALVTAGVGLASFAAAAAQSGQQIYTQFKAITTVSTALNTTIPPLTGALQQMSDAVRPQVFSLLGAGLNAINKQGGLMQTWALRTGAAFQDFAAHIDVFLSQHANGLNTFLEHGAADLTQLGKLFLGFGSIFMNFVHATQITQVAEKLLAALVVVVHALAVALNAVPGPALAAAIALHSIVVYGGFLVTGLRAAALAVDGLLAKFGPTSGAALTMAKHLGATNDELAAMAKGTPFLNQVASGVAAGSAGSYKLAEGLGISEGNLRKLVAQDPNIQSVAKSLGKTADEVAGVAIGFAKSGTSVEEFAAKAVGGGDKLAQLTAGLSGAERDAVNLAGAIGGNAGASSAVERLAATAAGDAPKVGIFQKAMTGLGAFLSGNWVLIAAAAAAAIGYIVYQAQQASPKITNFVNQINAELDKMGAGASFAKIPTLLGGVTDQLGSLKRGAEDLTGYWGQSFEKLGRGVNGLTGLLTGSGDAAKNFSDVWHGALAIFGIGLSTAANDTAKLTAEQQSLINYFDNLASAIYRSGKGYTSLSKQGFDLSQSLSILTLANVKQGDSLAVIRQKVSDLITGYSAMGQRAGEIGGDMNAITLAASNQLAAMGKLNTAWDTFTKLVSAPVDTLLSVAAAFNTFATDSRAAGAGASGLATKFAQLTGVLSPNSIKLQQDFQSTYSAVQQMFDAMRNSNAVTGASNFQKFVKDAVAALIPMVGTNKAAAAEVSALAQEAGGPATTNLQALAKWAGNVHDPMKAMWQMTQNAAVAASNLSGDAARLSNTLQQDLTPLMAQSILQAAKAGPAMQAFAAAVLKSHGNISALVPSATGLAQALLKTAGNAANAHALFDGMAEAMGLSKAQADKLWARINGQPLKPAIDTAPAEVGLHKFHSTVVAAVSPPATPPSGWQKLWDFIGGTWDKTVPQPIRHFLETDLVNWFHNSTSVISKGWNVVYTGFANDVSGKIEMFFVKDVVNWFNNSAHVISAGWGTVYTGFFNDVIHPVDHFFASSMPHYLDVVGNGFLGLWKNVWSWFDQHVIAPLDHFFTSSMPHYLGDLGNGFLGLWKNVWAWYDQHVWQPLDHFFTSSMPHYLGDLGNGFLGLWKNVWDWFNQHVWQPLDHFFTSSMPHYLGDLGNGFLNLWKSVWAWFNQHVWQPLDHFFTSSMPHYLSVLGNGFLNLWKSTWGWFNQHVWQPLDHFFVSSMPHYLGSLGNSFLGLWKNVWNWFTQHVTSPMGNWFTRTLPSAIEGAFKGAVNFVIRDIINKVIGFINDVTGVVGLPKIHGVQQLAAGGSIYDRQMARQGGSVPGPSSHDQHLAVLMGGEYVLRQPARMAIEQKMGRGYVDWLNHFDTWSASGSRGTMASRGMAAGGSYDANGFPSPGNPGMHLATGGQIEQTMLNYMLSKRGHPYLEQNPQRFGPTYYDCSGLMYDAAHAAGVPLPRGDAIANLEAEWFAGDHALNPYVYTARSRVQTGDILFFRGAAPGPSPWGGIGHVGMAASPATLISAYDTAQGVTTTPISQDAFTVGIGLGGPGGKSVVGLGGSGGLGGLFQSIGQVLGFLNPAGALTAAAKGLVGLVKGGASELMNLLSSGSRAVFDAVWGHTVAPLMNRILPKTSIVGRVGQWLPDTMKAGIDTLLGAKDNSARAQSNLGIGAAVASGVAAGSAMMNLIQLGKYLMAHGATRTAAAGIAGDVYGESGGNPEAVGSGGFGLIGWTGNTIGLPAGYHGPTGNPSRDLAIQIAGTLGYINANGGLGPINAAGNVVTAGQIFSAAYERPAKLYSDTRPGIAQQVYNALAAGGMVGMEAGGSVPSGGMLGTSVAGGAFTGGNAGMGLPFMPYASGGAIVPDMMAIGGPLGLMASGGVVDQVGAVFSNTTGRYGSVKSTDAGLIWDFIGSLGSAGAARQIGAVLSGTTGRTAQVLTTDAGKHWKYAPGHGGRWPGMGAAAGFPVDQSGSVYSDTTHLFGKVRSTDAGYVWDYAGSPPAAGGSVHQTGVVTSTATNRTAKVFSPDTGMHWYFAPNLGSAATPAPAWMQNYTPGPGSGLQVVPVDHGPVPNVNFTPAGLPAAGMASGGAVNLGGLLNQLSFAPGGYGRIGASSVISMIGSDAVSEPPRTRSPAAQATASGQGAQVTFGDINIINPRAEMASTSITTATQKAAFLAGRQLT